MTTRGDKGRDVAFLFATMVVSEAGAEVRDCRACCIRCYSYAWLYHARNRHERDPSCCPRCLEIRGAASLRGNVFKCVWLALIADPLDWWGKSVIMTTEAIAAMAA